MFLVDTILNLASNGLGALKEFLGLQSKKLDLKNTQAVQIAQAHQDEVSAVDKTNVAIAKKDLNELRKELAE